MYYLHFTEEVTLSTILHSRDLSPVMLSASPNVIPLANGRTQSNPGCLIPEAMLRITAVQGPTNYIPPPLTVNMQGKICCTIFKALGGSEEEYFITF